MEASELVTNFTTIQSALQVIATLQLTAGMFPKQAFVKDNDKFDFVIVGAGTAGCVIANRLTENEEFKVLLIEAGGDPPLEAMFPSTFLYIPKSRVDWKYISKGYDDSSKCHKDQVYPIVRGKMLGGSSSANGMVHVRGNPDDFHRWAEAANDSTWEWDNVLPYFIKSERLEDHEVLNSPYRDFHGTNGYMGLTRQMKENIPRYLAAFEEIGHKNILDVNGDDTLGYTQPMFAIADGLRQSTAYAFLTPIKFRENLHVLKNTLSSKIMFDGNRAVAVEVITENNNINTYRARKEIILSAGAINTAHLLMLSGIGPRDLLNSLNIDVIADLPVGKNLQDHKSISVSVKMHKSDAPPPLLPTFNEYPASLFIGLVALNRSQSYPDYQTMNIITPHDSTSRLQSCYVYRGTEYEICKRIYDAGIGREILSTAIIDLHPKSTGKITLKSNNPKDPPLIYHNFSNGTDLENLVKYIEHFSLVLESSYFKEANAELVTPQLPICDGLKPGTREYWFCYVRCLTVSFYHHAGTCAIGSVVDARLRVIGMQGLRIADASIMPTLTSGNINAPIVMIGEKVSDFIKQEYSAK